MDTHTILYYIYVHLSPLRCSLFFIQFFFFFLANHSVWYGGHRDHSQSERQPYHEVTQMLFTISHSPNPILVCVCVCSVVYPLAIGFMAGRSLVFCIVFAKWRRNIQLTTQPHRWAAAMGAFIEKTQPERTHTLRYSVCCADSTLRFFFYLFIYLSIYTLRSCWINSMLLMFSSDPELTAAMRRGCNDNEDIV